MTTNLFRSNILSYSEFCALSEATPEELKVRPNKDSFAPFAEPLGNMTPEEHKARNANHVFWKGHLPSWNHEYQMWEPHPHNIWGGQIEFAKDSNGKIKRDSSGKRIATEVKPNVITGLRHIRTGMKINNGVLVPSYSLSHNLPTPPDQPKTQISYTQHFVSRLHDADDSGEPNLEVHGDTPRIWTSPMKIHKMIVNFHDTIIRDNINPNYYPSKSLMLVSKGTGVHIPISVSMQHGVRKFSLLTHIPPKKNVSDEDKVIVESQTEMVIFVD